jgi:hypothetical protein
MKRSQKSYDLLKLLDDSLQNISNTQDRRRSVSEDKIKIPKSFIVKKRNTDKKVCFIS